MVTIGRPLIRLGAVTSTMDVAASLAADGAVAGTTVIATHQTQGRGRLDRAWIDRQGDSLLLSFILRPILPQFELGVLAPLLGLAVARTVAPICGQSVFVKWPNDVLVGERKLAGILVTARGGKEPAELIVGIGLNVNIDAEALPEGATSLADEAGTNIDLEYLRLQLFAQLSAVVTHFEDRDLAGDLCELQTCLAWRGEQVDVIDADRTVTGTVREVAHDGALVLDGPEERRIRIVAGSLVRGPRPVP
jgi:BirA family biotin operon repressor/biotin-[acetyl-CoA-carboxylase] ligase